MEREREVARLRRTHEREIYVLKRKLHEATSVLQQQELEQQEGEQQGEAPLNVMQVSQAASERVLQWCCKCCVNYGFSKDKCVVERLRKVVLLSLSWRLA